MLALYRAVSVAVLAARGHRSALPVQVRSDSVAVVDARTNAVAADIPLHTRPAAVAFGDGSLWVVTKDDHTLIQIDPRDRRVTRTFGLGAEPSAIATAGRYVWVLCARTNTLVEFDGDTGARVRTTRVRARIRVGPFKGRALQFPDALRLGEVPNVDLAVGAGAAWIGYGWGVVARVGAKSGVVEQIAAGSAHGIAFGDHAVWSVSDGRPSATGTITRIDVRTRQVAEIRRSPCAT